MKRRFLAITLLLAMVLAMLPMTAMAATSGTCGDSLTWTLDDAGTLTISGTGPMTAYTSSPDLPWDDNRDAIKNIVIEDGVTSIETWAFSDITGLTGITIPDSVANIGVNAFWGCANLADITIGSGVSSIGAGAFIDCSSLTGITIPDSVTNIGEGAFLRCTDLANVDIGSGVTTIENDAFSGCTALTGVTIPGGVTAIDDRTFNGCTSLTGITIPDSVASIGGQAFWDCTNLTSVTIPSGITDIKAATFYNCANLSDVYYWGTETDWTGISIAANNDPLTAATRWYPGSAAITTYTPETGAADPVVTITSDRPFAAIHVAARSTTMSNVTVDEGTTGLTLSSVSLDPADTSNKTMLLSFSGSSNGGNISVTIDSAAFKGPENFTSSNVTNIDMPAVPSDPVDPDPVPVDPDPAPVDPDPTPVTPGKPKDDPPVLIPSPIQGEAIRKDRKEIPDWIDRLDLPGYARTFYDVMAGNAPDRPAGGKKQSVFELERNFVLPSPSAGGTAQVELVEVVEFSMTDVYGAQGNGISSTLFEDESFFRVSADAGDKSIDYARLSMGSMVRTSAFNGIYVTKIPYDGQFDTEKKTVAEYMAAVFQAFDRDHPEIFWLSGKCKARVMVVTDPGTKAKEAYFFLSTADKGGFDMRAPAWTGTGAIASGIARRDAAVSGILGTVTAAGTPDKIKQLNKWLTEHNQYNTTPDLTTIGNEPHECLAALEGRTGTDGPVCDGYSRAFKVLCDRLSIPCVLETGWSKSRADAAPGFHMWNLAQVGGMWYGCDITWDDPSVKGVVGPISGRENENYLLIGSDSVVGGLSFAQSHVVQNQAAVGGVDFDNGPAMSPVAYSGVSATAFDDVPAGTWYYDGVYWAVDRGITVGTSATTFSPDQVCTEIQILTFLWRSAGKPVVDIALPFSVTGAGDYAGAAKWAYSKGMIGADFRQDAPCTRAAAVKFMWQAEGSPAATGSAFDDVPVGADYSQAVAWAVNRGVTTGTTATAFSPDQVCTRAQIVTLLCRDRA